jgi:hypothetical protein
MHELANSVDNKHQVCHIGGGIGLAAFRVISSVQGRGMHAGRTSDFLYHSSNDLRRHAFAM